MVKVGGGLKGFVQWDINTRESAAGRDLVQHVIVSRVGSES
jgi:hypothetical protein